jgi:hypothetical protein
MSSSPSKTSISSTTSSFDVLEFAFFIFFNISSILLTSPSSIAFANSSIIFFPVAQASFAFICSSVSISPLSLPLIFL